MEGRHIWWDRNITERSRSVDGKDGLITALHCIELLSKDHSITIHSVKPVVNSRQVQARPSQARQGKSGEGKSVRLR